MSAHRETPATLATTKRALEIGAQFIENDLAEQRMDARKRDEASVEPRLGQNYGSTEHEIMKAMEWASAAARLRMLAEREEG